MNSDWDLLYISNFPWYVSKKYYRYGNTKAMFYLANDVNNQEISMFIFCFESPKIYMVIPKSEFSFYSDLPNNQDSLEIIFDVANNICEENCIIENKNTKITKIQDIEIMQVALINIYSLFDYNNGEYLLKKEVVNYLNILKKEYNLFGYLEDHQLAFNLMSTDQFGSYVVQMLEHILEHLDHIIINPYTSTATNPYYAYTSKLDLNTSGLLGAVENFYMSLHLTMVDWKKSIVLGSVDKDKNFASLNNLPYKDINNDIFHKIKVLTKNII